jgi:simple sugar transport system ATP-binding protein
MSILAGLYRPDAGQIVIHTKPVVFHAPKDAIDHGIGMVYQHYRLVTSQTVAENLLLGMPGVPFRLHASRFVRQARELGERYHLHIDPSRPVWQLSVGEQQRVEILKTLQRGAKILILDEPTAVLTPIESHELMRTLRQIAAEGRTVILISHKLEEVREVADRVTVLRGGTVVASGLSIGDVSTRELARLMVGETAPPLQANGEGRDSRVPHGSSTGERLVLDNVYAKDDRGLTALKGVNLWVAEGEILGIAGVAGNGQRELAHVVSGLRPPTSGRVQLDGHDITRLDARQRARRGVANIPEDRLGEGLIGNLPLTDNAILKCYDRPPAANGLFINLQWVFRFTQSLIEKFGIRGARPQSLTRLLSGGQLQRFLLAREMALDPRLILAVHPTRGLDVAATQQVQQWLVSARDQGASVLLISEDLDEVMQLSDRIAVMYEGRILETLIASGADRESIGLMMAGSRGHPAEVA